MKELVSLCILFVSTLCVSMLKNESDQSWELFKQVYNKKYGSFEEETTR